ncbi:MAG: type II CRISPR RNA-guided endonuclease Cas9 [Planctomycetota bacterium]|nr:type II CRISPR RNA-guided endonuclease Cas9 [Planctomycetota bacterium]
MDSYTLGLDIGSNSIGWALVNSGRDPSIVDIGVRVFPEGVDRDTKGLEKSKNATRRDARGARRVHERRRGRRKELVRTLRAVGLLPDGEAELLELLRQKDPYELRARGLDEQLEPCELGRVLYHLDQRRGFKSNRKSGKATEEGQIARAAGELQGRIDQSGCRTLGEYLAGAMCDGERIRDHYTFRSMYEHEFDLLWAKQGEFHGNKLTDALRSKVRDEVIFYQRPLKPTDDLIGDCELEPGEKRCPRGDWYARRFRLLQDANNLRICNPDGSVRRLEPGQRVVLLDELNKKKEVKFTAIRKKLGLLETQGFNVEYEVNDKGKKNDKLIGDVFNVSMRSKKIFGVKAWDTMEEAEKIKLNEWLVELEDDELREKLGVEYGFDEEQINGVLSISLPRRYMSFSRKAIRRLLPTMEHGMRTDEALEEVYPDRNMGNVLEEVDKLPLPEDLRNPIVNRALFEVRKVVNAIIRVHGRPEKINIEMARDVRGGARERREIHFKMLDNKKRNEEVRSKLKQDMNISNPSRNDVIKYKLWDECGHVCPYTGKHISQTALFGSNPEFQIEHILPYRRSLDDSFMNKTLCCVKENRLKGNQMPYEFYNGDAERFDELKQRVNRTAMPYWKKKKFWQKEIDTDVIISRELNDTRYICREVVKYLRQICKDVRGTRGKITHELGYQWGFVKDRDDHRHHAIDAGALAS